MKIPNSRTSTDISENMMTSMIDVVFLLLVFFVCAATGQVHEALLPQKLPEGGVKSTSVVEVEPGAPDKIWIELKTSDIGQTLMLMNETEYDSFAALRETLSALAAVAPENPVILNIGPEVPAGDMIRVYDTCRAAGFQVINFNIPPERLINTDPVKR